MRWVRRDLEFGFQETEGRGSGREIEGVGLELVERTRGRVFRFKEEFVWSGSLEPSLLG